MIYKIHVTEIRHMEKHLHYIFTMQEKGVFQFFYASNITKLKVDSCGRHSFFLNIHSAIATYKTWQRTLNAHHEER